MCVCVYVGEKRAKARKTGLPIGATVFMEAMYIESETVLLLAKHRRIASTYSVTRTTKRCETHAHTHAHAHTHTQ